MKNFQELIVWQKSHQLLLEVYRVTKKFPKEEQFNLTSQLRRAALSIGSNIAEGFKRGHRKESLQFYNVAAGSLEEAKYQLIVAKDLGYLQSDEYIKLEQQADEVGKLINGWARSQGG